MIETTGDLWKQDPGALIVVPTNIGWRWDGRNVMGRGVAAQAAARFEGLADWYGSVCRTMGEWTPVVRYFSAFLLLFPVKPLYRRQPQYSWKQNANLELIDRSARQLAAWFDLTPWQGKIVLPLVGCGNGGLKPASVMPILRGRLKDDRFILVREDGRAKAEA